MLESPIIDEALEFMRLRTIREAIRRFLKARFGVIAPDRLAALTTIRDGERLENLVDLAGKCSTLEAFIEELDA